MGSRICEKNMSLDNNKQDNEKNAVISENASKECACSNRFLDKRFIATCLTSIVLAGTGAFCVIKLGTYSYEQDIQKISKKYDSLTEKLQNIYNSIAALESSFSKAKQESNKNQEKFAYVYSKIASIQQDISLIKNEFHIDDKNTTDPDLQKMSVDQVSFLESLETLINEGAPFAEFLKSKPKFNVQKYQTGKALLDFAEQKVPSISELQKTFTNVGSSEFGISLNETFWEKQKRVIKEKFTQAITIKRNDNDNEQTTETLDDKSLFAKASEYMNDGKIEEAVATLEKIESYHEDLNKFIKSAKQRIDLSQAFVAFKKEFIEIETKSADSNKE